MGTEIDRRVPAFLRSGCSCRGQVPFRVRPRGLKAHGDESDDGAVTTVTFEEKGGKTLLVMHELYPSKEALDANAGAESGMPETFAQLDELLVTLGASVGRS